MPIRLVAVDLDGTLLDSRWEISPANRQALIEATARGVFVAVVTGRRFHSARSLLHEIPCPVTLIASNGAVIGSPSGEIFHRDFLPRRVARQVLEAAREYRPYAVEIFDLPGKGQVVMQDSATMDGPLAWYLDKSPEVLTRVADLAAALERDPVQLMFGGPPARLEPLEDLLRASAVASEVHTTWTKYFTRNLSIFDVLNRGCSKGRALELWAERCGVARAEVMAIGDNYNDLEMLRFSGLPVLMGNRTPGLDEEGWRVTLSNDQDGVAAAIRSYVLGNAEL